MGEVYAAFFAGGLDGIEKRCVIKTLHPDIARDREYVTRFLDEARVAVRLSQRNICQVFDVGVIDDHHYIAMELVRGRDLRSIVRRATEQGAPVDAALALHIIAEVLDGLRHAHELTDELGRALAIVHRDVSPQNIMVSFDGDVKLIDFGLAASTIKVEQTERNVVMGKMAYMPPEQARGERADASADVFACAVVLYELLTASRYYEGIAAMHLPSVVAGGAHQPALWATLDPALASIVQQALHPDRAARTSSAGQFAGDLRAWAQSRGLRGDATQLRHFIRVLFGEAREPWELAVPPQGAASDGAAPTGPHRTAKDEGWAAPTVTGSVALTERVRPHARDVHETSATVAGATGDPARASFMGPRRHRGRRARAVAAATSAVVVTGLVLVGRAAWRSDADGKAKEKTCVRTIRVVPADHRPIPSGTTVRVSLPRFAGIPITRQRGLTVRTFDGVDLPRTVDLDDDGELSVVVLLPEVPLQGLQLHASACGEPSKPASDASVYAHTVDGTDTIHWQTRCGAPTTDMETCGLSRLPEGPRDALQAILRATCRVDPYDGYDMTAERELTLPAGAYVVEGSWTTSTVLYDFCAGVGAHTGGAVELTLNGRKIAEGPHSQTGGTPGRECEADVEYQPSATNTAPLHAVIRLQGRDRLGVAVKAGDCALVTAQVRLGVRRVATPEPIVRVGK